MAHTNSTPNYNLPQFLGSDKPAWLTDINTAMSDIDTAIAAAKTVADTANTAVGSLSTTVGNHTTQLTTLSGTVTSQGNTLNTVTALIGNGTPTTTDQTIIGAINELHADLIGTVTTGTDTQTTSGGGYTSTLDYGNIVSVTAFNQTDSTYVIPLYRSTSGNKILVRFFDESLTPIADGKTVVINVRYLNATV